MRNGTTATHACPSKVSTSNCGGISGRKTAASIGQCAKSRSCQLWAITHCSVGRGQGRCATFWRMAFTGARKAFSTSSFSKYTLAESLRIEFSGFKQNERAIRREIMQRKASAVWQGGLKDGKGSISTDSGVLKQTQYSFSTRFENGAGTNPEELLAAAHAGCFTMALSAQLGNAGITPESLETTAAVTLEKLEAGFTITKVHLDVTAKIPGADRAAFEKAAQDAKAGCPISRLLKAEITMTARLSGDRAVSA